MIYLCVSSNRITMKVIIESILPWLILLSCNNRNESFKSPYEQLCKNFLESLYNNDPNGIMSCMDDSFIKASKSYNIDSSFNEVSRKFQHDFQGGMTSTLITSEEIIQNKLPTALITYKVESRTKLRYYYFYVNENSNKILIFSESGRIQEKR